MYVDSACRVSVLIVVDALAGFLSKAAGLHVLHKQRTWTILLAECLMQKHEDIQARVEAHEIDHLERTHWMVQAELERLVDIAGTRNSFLQHVERFVPDQRVDSRGDKARRLLHFDRLLTHSPRNGFRKIERLVRSFEAANNLYELHLVNGVKEMHADDAVRPL